MIIGCKLATTEYGAETFFPKSTCYTVKQTGLTCAGPKKCASVNVVVSHHTGKRQCSINIVEIHALFHRWVRCQKVHNLFFPNSLWLH